MIWRARLFFVLLGVSVLIFVINLVRTKKLKEEYALLWLLMAGTLVIAPLLIDVIDTISFAIGIDYPPALMIVIALICFALIFFQLSVTISRFSEQIKTLSQDLALTRRRLRDLEQAVALHTPVTAPGPAQTDADKVLDGESVPVERSNVELEADAR